MKLSSTQNEHDAIHANPIVVSTGDDTVAIAHADAAGEDFIVTVTDALAILETWAVSAAAGTLRQFGHAADLKVILLAEATADGLQFDY